VLREINHFEKLCPDGGRQQAWYNSLALVSH
jgi:hypothetical protein